MSSMKNVKENGRGSEAEQRAVQSIYFDGFATLLYCQCGYYLFEIDSIFFFFFSALNFNGIWNFIFRIFEAFYLFKGNRFFLSYLRRFLNFKLTQWKMNNIRNPRKIILFPSFYWLFSGFNQFNAFDSRSGGEIKVEKKYEIHQSMVCGHRIQFTTLLSVHTNLEISLSSRSYLCVRMNAFTIFSTSIFLCWYSLNQSRFTVYQFLLVYIFRFILYDW